MNTTVATRDDRPPMVVLRDRLQQRQGELKAALGPDIPVETFIRAVMTSVALNPEILACSFQSIWNSCLRACRDGLIPDGQDAAIVPFKSTASYIPMYSGLLRRFRRSGQFRWITAGIVRQGEEFEHWIGADGEHFRHVPGDDVSRPIIKAYSVATTKDGGIFVAVMPKAEVDKIRAQSRATREDSPWNRHYEEMAKKTALRRLSKYLPSARDLLPDEEALDIEASSPALPSPPEEPSSVAAGEEGGAQGAPTAADESAARTTPAERPAAADQSPSEDPIAAAYRRGIEAKAASHRRSALPGEYRGSAQSKLADAWFAGFDGKPMPPQENEGAFI
jgi:recombination protein RecT